MEAALEQKDQGEPVDQVSWFVRRRNFVFFWTAHALVLLVFVVPFSWSLVGLAAATYFLRMFGITAGYHRYFAHRSYKTSRVFQFILAFLGGMSAQKGALWWAAHHRDHHRYSDQPEDVHSPVQRGFWFAHVGWVFTRETGNTKFDRIQDFADVPELRWLNKNHLVPPVVGLIALGLIGGLPWIVWGGIVSTVALWHGTFTINSLAHVWGARRYQTTDTSRNNLWLALITMGEGWHNNHHHYQSATNQGFFWWEVDATYYILKGLSFVGIVRDLRNPPLHIRDGK